MCVRCVFFEFRCFRLRSRMLIIGVGSNSMSMHDVVVCILVMWLCVWVSHMWS